MTHGIDTDFLVAAEVREHPFHDSADALLRSLLADGHDFAIAPQTLLEFVHVVTDPKRMPKPLSMTEAIARAEHWWQAREVVRVFPDGVAVSDFFAWMVRYRLGRKRLLDTLLATTFLRSGVRRVISNNKEDLGALPGLEVIGFKPR